MGRGLLLSLRKQGVAGPPFLGSGTPGPPLLHPQRDPMRENNKRSPPINPPLHYLNSESECRCCWHCAGTTNMSPCPPASLQEVGRQRKE